MNRTETQRVDGGLRAVVYARVSTDAQERDGTSLDTQERAGIEFAEAKGWSVVRCLRDTASGATLDRTGMDELRGLIRRGDADVVIAYAVDRLARDQIKLAVLIDAVYECGARLEIVTEPFETSAIGQFLMSARGFAAQLEREKIAERTQRGKGALARSGKLPQATGRGIYGYTYDPKPGTGTRSVNETQAPVVRRIFAEFIERQSCHGIAECLNAESVPAFAGGSWYALTVRRILVNETYTGRTVYRRTRAERVRNPETGKRQRRVVTRDESEWIDVPGATPAIISAETFERARQIFADPERRRRLNASGTYPLRGRIRCERCGAAMVGQNIGRTEKRYRYYRCTKGTSGPGQPTCDSKYVRADALERLVRDELAAVLADPTVVVAEARRASAADAGTVRAEDLRRQLDDVEAQQSRLADLYISGTLDRTALDTKARALDVRASALREESRVAHSAVGRSDAAAIEAGLPRALDAVRAWVAAAEGDALDLLLRALDVQIVASTQRVTVGGRVPVEGQPGSAGFSVETGQVVSANARTGGADARRVA